MTHQFFSDREVGPRPRVLDDVPDPAWGGIVGAFDRARDAHRFGGSFPEQCPDGRGVSGTSLPNLMVSLRGQIPTFNWPPRADQNPGVLVAMDLVEFAWQHIARPNPIGYHDFFGHDHLRFDADSGRAAWRDEINQILTRNGVALELGGDGYVTRIGPPSVEAAFQQTLPASGDARLDELVEAAVRRFRDPDANARREALEPLWDALERIKTVLDPNKRKGVTLLIQHMATDAPTQAVLETEFRALTDLGNDFQIRHHEVTQQPVPASAVDYLFVRAYDLLVAAVLALAANPLQG